MLSILCIQGLFFKLIICYGSEADTSASVKDTSWGPWTAREAGCTSPGMDSASSPPNGNEGKLTSVFHESVASLSSASEAAWLC